MTEEYNPTKKEILNEMWGGITASSRRVTHKVGKSFKGISSKAGRSLKETSNKIERSFKETSYRVRKSFKEAPYKVGRSLIISGKSFGFTALLTARLSHTLPTFIRYGCDANVKSDTNETPPTQRKKSLGEFSRYEVISVVSGICSGLVVGVGGQLSGYVYALEKGYPEVLLIPVATNVASGAYEIGRKMYNNARQRVLEKHKTEGLEATIQE